MPASSNAFSRVEFLISAGVTGGMPPADLPELAFAGRSNVGKSSAINALANRKRLAFVSKTPGHSGGNEELDARKGVAGCRHA
jgi:GTP-binding protein